jgi:hypothetical protein
MKDLSMDSQMSTNDNMAKSRFNSVAVQIQTELSTIDSACKMADGFTEPILSNPTMKKKLEPLTEKLDKIRDLTKEASKIISSLRSDSYHAY